MAPGRAFALAINSAMVLTPTPGWTTRTLGTRTTNDTGTRSFAVSYGIFGYRN